MLKIYTSILMTCLPFLAIAQCPTVDVTLTTQGQVNDFNTTYAGCTAPTRSITITGSSIANLAGLQNITSIGGDLVIQQTSLINLTGLNSLTQVGGSVELNMNQSMSTLSGLQNLVSIYGRLRLWDNPITTLQGLSSLEYIGGAFDASYMLATDLSGMEKVTHLGALTLVFNSELTSLNGLDNAVAATYNDNLYVIMNDRLANCVIQYICFRRPDSPGTIGHEIGSNDPSGTCQEGAIDDACYEMTLPVTLISFDARKTGENRVALTWATSSETNSKHFEIQKNNGRGAWITLGTVNAQNESSHTVQYSFSDPRPSNGTNLYRLKMVDMDDTFAYSRITAVNFNNIRATGVYPNPVTDRFQLGADDLEGFSEVELVNTAGQVVFTSPTIGSEGIDIQKLPSGMYVVNVKKKDGQLASYKVFKNNR